MMPPPPPLQQDPRETTPKKIMSPQEAEAQVRSTATPSNHSIAQRCSDSL